MCWATGMAAIKSTSLYGSGFQCKGLFCLGYSAGVLGGTKGETVAAAEKE